MYTNKEAFLLLAKGEKITKKAWGCLAYVYLDSFGIIRHSDGHREYNWNKNIQSDSSKRWKEFLE